ncbi:MAG TPA: bifunctional phosphoribosylaminoimidazolecarboxamide formyltransferase/IMP cyclohydrolase PurH [Bacteroidales bacterium]|nr:bifunctional phosphoribosylaminoimidazolecarboxamide formyltransferase/IMP cyclohydrolase PurH [Bacteroidales bacterium]
MIVLKPIKNALISVFHKDGLIAVLEILKRFNIQIITTGGSFQYIVEAGFLAKTVESFTDYPSIFGGRVKTLHPIIFGGILYRRDLISDQKQAVDFNIPPIDLVIVDLYPFEKTLSQTSEESEIIEKIDIGGISLIRAAAKNFQDVLVVSSVNQYAELVEMLEKNHGQSSLIDRKRFAMHAFDVSSHYDTAIFNYFNRDFKEEKLKLSLQEANVLRYGENPHQKGVFYGKLDQVFEQLHGKAISYNNLIDLDGAIALIKEFEDPTFAILKHTNACGLASDTSLLGAWKKALAGDPVSAFGGVLICNRSLDEETALEVNKLFFEIILAPDYEKNALESLKTKKNRIILRAKSFDFQSLQFKSTLNGVIAQEKDLKTEDLNDWDIVTDKAPTIDEALDLVFANKLVKHTKSNAIVLAKEGQLIGSGTGQTSRIDALKHAIQKAKDFGFDLNGSVMASDAFFPFSDSVETAEKEGIKAIIQPGGSVRDQDSIDYCNKTKIAMVFTGNRHFKH